MSAPAHRKEPPALDPTLIEIAKAIARRMAREDHERDNAADSRGKGDASSADA